MGGTSAGAEIASLEQVLIAEPAMCGARRWDIVYGGPKVVGTGLIFVDNPRWLAEDFADLRWPLPLRSSKSRTAEHRFIFQSRMPVDRYGGALFDIRAGTKSYLLSLPASPRT